MHNAGARIVVRDGSSLLGWTNDLKIWDVDAEPPIPFFEVWPEVDDPLTVDVDDVLTVTPLQDQTDPASLMRDLARAIAQPQDVPDREAREFRLILDDHSYLEVMVRREHRWCLPWTPRGTDGDDPTPESLGT
jgi:hypothetical protein